MGKTIIFFLISIFLISLVSAVNYEYLYNPYTTKLDRTIKLNQSSNTFIATNISLHPNCVDGQILKWNNGYGVCGTDATGSGFTQGESLSALNANFTGIVNSSDSIYLNYATPSQCLQTNANGKIVSSGGACGGSGEDSTKFWNWVNNESLVLDNGTILRVGNLSNLDTLSKYIKVGNFDLKNISNDTISKTNTSILFNWNFSNIARYINDTTNITLYNYSISLNDYPTVSSSFFNSFFNKANNLTSTTNLTLGNLTTENLKVIGSPVPCPANTGMTYTNMTTSICSSNITDWARIGTTISYDVGNVGIGTTSPNSPLGFSPIIDISGANYPGISLTSTAVGGNSIQIGKITKTDLGIIVGTDYKIVLLADGNVGIGTTSPTYKLQVNGETNLNNTLYVNGTSKMVGINITSPTKVFHSVGDFNLSAGKREIVTNSTCVIIKGLTSEVAVC